MKKKILIAILAVIVVGFISGCIIFRDEIGKVRHHIYPINKNLEDKGYKVNVTFLGDGKLYNSLVEYTKELRLEKLHEKSENSLKICFNSMT